MTREELRAASAATSANARVWRAANPQWDREVVVWSDLLDGLFTVVVTLDPNFYSYARWGRHTLHMHRPDGTRHGSAVITEKAAQADYSVSPQQKREFRQAAVDYMAREAARRRRPLW